MVVFNDSPLEQEPLLPDVLSPRCAHLYDDPLRLMDVAAEEVARLVGFDKLADGSAASVEALVDAVEGGVVRWSVTNQNERVELGELRQVFAHLLLRIFAWGGERRGGRVAQARYVDAFDLDLLPVEVVETVAGAEVGDVGFGLVIAGQDVDFFGLREPRPQLTKSPAQT